MNTMHENAEKKFREDSRYACIVLRMADAWQDGKFSLAEMVCALDLAWKLANDPGYHERIMGYPDDGIVRGRVIDDTFIDPRTLSR